MVFERRLRPWSRYIQSTRHDRVSLPLRPFTTTLQPQQEVIDTTSSTPPPPPPNSRTSPSHLANIVHTPRSERKLFANHGLKPIGSRRRRAAIAFTNNIPFPQLPYQCFQEARKILMEDRREKVEEIGRQRERIERLRGKVEALPEGGRGREVQRLKSMRRSLEELKVLADVNDPVVKKRFEDGDADMTKPVYRHLANKAWRTYKRKVLLQRITQMHLIPDVLPSLDPTVSTTLTFNNRTKIQHGDIVPSSTSEQAPTLSIQPFERGDKLLTIAVVNPDVPDVEKDGFDYRCHFLACNVPVSPTLTRVDFAALDPRTQVVMPWFPPFAQKGLGYQRLGVFVFEQEDASQQRDVDGAPAAQRTIDVAGVRGEKGGKYAVREGFNLRSLVSKFGLKGIGVDLFRTKWDGGTAGVMERAGVVGAEVEFKRKKVQPLPYQRLKGSRFR